MAPPSNRASHPPGQDAVTTSILLGNLHCPSCVSTIREVLQEACADHIRWVSPNIVTSVVTVEHDADTSLRDMVAVLADAGFDICGVTSSTSGDDIVDFDFDTPPAWSAGPSSIADADVNAEDDNNESDDDEDDEDDTHKGDISTDRPPSSSKAAAGPSSSSSSWGLTPLVRWMSGSRVERRRSLSFATADRIAQAHLSNCEQCRQLQSAGVSPLPLHKTDKSDKTEPTEAGPSKSNKTEDTSKSASEESSSNIGNTKNTKNTNNTRTTATASPAEKPADMGKSFVTVEHEDAPVNRPVWRASLAVGGMTCAVCVNAITDDLKKKDWITKITVNLISNSATVEFDDKSKESKIVEAIEGLGYDATIDTVVRIDPPKPKTGAQQTNGAAGGDSAEPEQHERTVEIRIDGLYCEHCPDRIARSLAGFRQPSLEIITKPTPQRPIIKLKYVPEVPNFTIRHILAAIEASDSELSASIYHPPTLEERSKIIQAKHQRQIMYRVIFTGIVCIPTFIIGIVYMSLLPSTNHGRMYMMAPWASGISRSQIALFILATPVYFFSADLFHVRALKEVRLLWRRSSRTPFLQRFYRFGSMNTLMSLGTTIAYVSSVSQMIAAAAQKASEVSDSNFYFDSVVFLTFFLLCGRLIETYSKSRTGDAIEMLGRLRPTTAILVEESVSSLEEKDVVEINTEAIQSVTSATEQDAHPSTLPPQAATGNKSGRVVQADLLDFGDVVRVLHGASPPADGVIVQGRTNFDESSLTGESRLVPKTVGDEVFSGTVNKDAPVLVRVTGASGTSMLDQIVAVVREGQTKRAPMEQIADLLTTYFVPVVTLVAISTWIIWLSLGLSGSIPGDFLDVSSGGWVAFSLQFAISVFVVACPCGLGLAAPTAIFVAGGMAAKYGILAKGGGEAFEKASRIDCVVFDKTGTLTMGGEPTVTDSAIFTGSGDDDSDDSGDDAAPDNNKSDLLAALKAVEENSGHPIAKAIVAFCESSTYATTGPGGNVGDLQEIAGRGMRATFHSRASSDRSFEIIVGNEALMKDYSVAVSDRVVSLLQQWKTDAKSVALAATRPLSGGDDDNNNNNNNQPWMLATALSIADPVRPEAAAIIKALHSRSVLVYMLSGDNAITAAAVARQLGIPANHVIAEVLPTEKAAKVQYLQASLQAHTSRWGRTVKEKVATSSSTDSNGTSTSTPTNGRRAVVAMVGDGINDSPALTQADVGIAVGSGSDVAISSADFVLVQSNLQAVVTLLELSRVVFRRIAFNFGWALVYNAIAVPIAAGVLYPIHTASTSHVRLNPVWASLAMALSSISVVLSSLALRSRIPGMGFRPTIIKTPTAVE